MRARDAVIGSTALDTRGPSPRPGIVTHVAAQHAWLSYADTAEPQSAKVPLRALAKRNGGDSDRPRPAPRASVEQPVRRPRRRAH